MRVRRNRLRAIIRECILVEKGEVYASDVTKFKPTIEEWVDVLIDELGKTSPRVLEMDDRRRSHVVRRLTDVVALEMIGLFGHPIDPKKTKRRETAKRKKQEREQDQRRSSAVNYSDRPSY